MNYKFPQRLLSLVLAGAICFGMLPTAAFAENIQEEPIDEIPVSYELIEDDPEEDSPVEEDMSEDIAGEQEDSMDEAILEDTTIEPAMPPQETVVEEELPAEPEIEFASEKCVAYEHLSDANAICSVCGIDLIDEFIFLCNSIDSTGYLIVMNRWGWLEQHLSEDNRSAYEEASEKANELFQTICDAVDVFSCFEIEVEDGVSDELVEMLLKLYALDADGRTVYNYPQDPEIFENGAIENPNEEYPYSDDILFEDMPDAPTGSYIGSRGLPVATGETKFSISPWNSTVFQNEKGRFDESPLDKNNISVSVGTEPGKDYAIVPILTQVEYPENGSSSYITLPDDVVILRFDDDRPASESMKDSILHASYKEMSAAISGFFVRAEHDFTATFTYVDANGNTFSKDLHVAVGDNSDSGFQNNHGTTGAALFADRPTPSTTSGKITRCEYVGDTWLIWFNGQEAYCCNHGLRGGVNGCPNYSYAYTSVLEPGQYTGDHYTTQIGVWGGLGQLSLNMLETAHEDKFSDSSFYSRAISTYSLEEEVLMSFCYSIYDDTQMYIITHYPESNAAQIYLESARSALSNNASTYASDTGYYTYIYTPAASGWQTIAVIGPETDEAGEPVEQEYYADWSAPPQTAHGEFTFKYNIGVDKYQLDTKEKVDDAVIDIEPVTKSGSIDGGSWSITPTTKQTVTTSGHTNDDNYQKNGGDGSASWSLHYEVTKTSGSRSGSVGPYSSQEEADDAASDARSDAIRELKAEAQGMVNRAINSAKSQLNTLKFTYDEKTVPYGFLAYSGSYGSNQTITVPHDTNADYPMQNDEWSLKVSIEKIDSETHNQITADAEFQVFEWDVVTQQYIPFGGYNQYKVERQDDGTYKVINHSAYATNDSMKQTLYYTQRNQGKFIIVETTAPAGYYGDWTDVEKPGTAGTPLGKRGYYIEITRAKDGSTIWLDNADYNADIATKYTNGTKLITAEGVAATVTIGGYKDSTKEYNTDNSKTAANEDSYTMTPMQACFQNDRVLGEISLSKVDLDAVRYVNDHGNADLEGAVYDLYVADDIAHPDGKSGTVDYSKILNAEGNPIWHTTIRDNSGNWITDYLPVLCKDHLVASAKINNGWLTFSNLYIGNYYIVERSTGTVIPVDDGAFFMPGSYPQVNAVTKQPTGGLGSLAKNSAGQYTDYVYKNQFSSVSQSKDLAGNKTYDGYYISYAEGYLCDEHNYYITPKYENEGWYVEKTVFEDDRQGNSYIDNTKYSRNYHIHADNDLAESQDQVMKANVQISKVISSTGQSNGLDLEGAGFMFFLISDLSKADQFEKTDSGSFKLDSILNAYINPTYSDTELKYDFSVEENAIAKTYEVNTAEILAYNRSLTGAEDCRNGSGKGWEATDVPQQYQLSEIFSNDTGTIRVEGLPYGQYLCVETTIPHDLYQAEPFIINVSAADTSAPQSGMATPRDAAVPGSNSALKYTVLDEEIEVYLRIIKVDDETGKSVLLPDTAFQIYWLNDNGEVIQENGEPKLVVMTDTTTGHLTKSIDTFYTTEEGILTLPEHLPLGHFRIVEVNGPNGFYNEWLDTGEFWTDFEVSTDRAYKATGFDGENSQDELVIDEEYHNHETLGVLTIRKTGEVLVGWDNDFIYEERPIADAEYTITAVEDVYTQDWQKDSYGNRTLWYAKGDVVAVVKTGDGTNCEVKFAPGHTTATYDFLSVIHDGTVGEVKVTLPLGSYHVEETKPPYGFIGTSQSYDVTFEWSDQLQDVVMASSITNHAEDGTSTKSDFTITREKDADAAFLEQQVLKFYNEREKARVGVYKVDKETGEYLAGAVFALYAADDIYSADGDLIFKAGDFIANSPATVDDGYTYFEQDIPIRGELYGQSTEKNAATNSGNYYIQEIQAPDGYYLNDERMDVSFTYDGEALMVLDNTCTNRPTEMWVSKRELTGDDELPGATLTIEDAEGNVVREWLSGTEPQRITGLHLEEAYTLTETRPADGYALADSITFQLVQKVAENGSLLLEAEVYYLTIDRFLFWTWEDWELLDAATVIMRDETTKVEISKKDLANGEELAGATLVITDTDGNEIERWISSNEPHFIEKLPASEYILTEITAPDGYAIAESIRFEVLPTGEIQTVTMYDKRKPTPTPDDGPDPTPEPAPESTPEPTPEITPSPIPVISVPQTGDTEKIYFWYGMCAVCLVGLATCGAGFLHRKRDSDSEKSEDND